MQQIEVTTQAEIQAAINALVSGQLLEIITTVPIDCTGPIYMNKPGVTLTKEYDLVFNSSATGADVGIEITAAECKVKGPGTVRNTALSGIMFLRGADNSTVEGGGIANYNTKDAEGHAAVFAYGYDGAGNPIYIPGITVRGVTTSQGNGMGVRLDCVQDALIIDNKVSQTRGSTSSEGMGAGGKNIKFIRNWIDRPQVTGLLIFNGGNFPFENFLLDSNTVSNAQGGNTAYVFNPQGQTISGVICVNNIAYDDQPARTMEQAILLSDDGQGGSLQHGVISNNVMWGCRQTNPISVQLKNQSAQLIDWKIS